MKTQPEPEEKSPEELVGTFSRSPNYPRDKEGVLFLAQGLAKAAKASGIAAAAIVARCQELSAFCPTDYDFQQVAIELAMASRPAPPKGCRECHGTGWRSFVLHVKTGAGEYDADFADHCDCELGRFRRAAEYERKRKAEEKRGLVRVAD